MLASETLEASEGQRSIDQLPGSTKQPGSNNVSVSRDVPVTVKENQHTENQELL